MIILRISGKSGYYHGYWVWRVIKCTHPNIVPITNLSSKPSPPRRPFPPSTTMLRPALPPSSRPNLPPLNLSLYVKLPLSITSPPSLSISLSLILSSTAKKSDVALFCHGKS